MKRTTGAIKGQNFDFYVAFLETDGGDVRLNRAEKGTFMRKLPMGGEYTIDEIRHKLNVELMAEPHFYGRFPEITAIIIGSHRGDGFNISGTYHDFSA